MKKSIVYKLFIITAAFLLAFFILTMNFQSVFFEEFYKSRKMKNLKISVERFNDIYSNNNLSNSQLYIVMRQFEENNNAKIVVLGSNGVAKYLGDSKMDSDSSKINTLNKILNGWVDSPDRLAKIIRQRKTIVGKYYNTDFDINNIICISPSVDRNNSDVIVAVSSLQPIQEASDTIRAFYIYIFAGGVVMIIILALIYSNMLSKPLIKLNKSAENMLKMDFSVKCDVNSKDEIGNLANTLNILSDKLDNALNELRQQNEQLEADIEKERKMESMRKEFVAGVSHELKTPISLISGYAEGLMDNVVDEESRSFYIDVIMDEAQKMGNLVHDMLDLSQLESGSFNFNPRNFYINSLISECVHKHKELLKERCIDIETISDNIEVYGDETRIEQVITNFLTNAIRNTPDSGTIKITVFDKDNDNVQIQVENDGEHIEQKEMENIWDKFYKIDKSRTRNTGGTGLGLSITKNILLAHKSTFGVKNIENGVMFYFTLRKAI
ncbi:sensor histidine kinase [Clostridium oryzae]|uniref:histidine kinase n=1 Tax=Clostridium oryzae TaxID=1450648 RepID=A0A1V4IC07_9CLOT|nr:HAMP domain-containing sensor histidine kinase [Clostridium oryzae]OPJ57538.1 alkaline phosphatase synthesis sensor protein PhoR [Clostridium oryzae]